MKILRKKQIDYRVSLGDPLDGTYLRLQTDDGSIIPLTRWTSAEGTMWIGGRERKCILNDEKWDQSNGILWRQTGDIVRISGMP